MVQVLGYSETQREKIAEIQDICNRLKNRVFVRSADNLLIILPNESVKLNDTATRILKRIFSGQRVERVIKHEAHEYNLNIGDVIDYLHQFFIDLLLFLDRQIDEYHLPPTISTVPYKGNVIKLPVLSEIALTYRCNNKCMFCYAASDNTPFHKEPDMTIARGKVILHKIRYDAQVPTVSFTGGEPTLKKKVLLALTEYATTQLGMRVNLISNGTLLTDDYVNELAEKGLKSAQISLEGSNPTIHDFLTQNKGSWEKTTRAIRILRDHGIFTHTNTTISKANKDDIDNLVHFLATELELDRFSANLVIPSGWALKYLDHLELHYTQIPPIVRRLKDLAHQYGLEFFWYSPTPYCIFNPIKEGLGMKSCSACDGLLSVSPSGQIKPCSSFQEGVGNIEKQSFKKIWNSKSARFWRKKQFVPPTCHQCEYLTLCYAACPLYFDVYGYHEISKTKKPNLLTHLKFMKLKFQRQRIAKQGGFLHEQYKPQSPNK